MVTGIDASITTVTPGTTIRAADAMANWNALNANGVSNDGGLITTDNAGGLTAVGLKTTGGGLLVYNITPYLIISNITINAGNTNNYTCAGVGGIPSGVKGVYLAIAANATNAGNILQFAPHSGTVGIYPQLGTFQATGAGGTIFAGIYVPVDASGGFDVKTSGTGSCTLTAYINAYTA
jgi:hypothetical protein